MAENSARGKKWAPKRSEWRKGGDDNGHEGKSDRMAEVETLTSSVKAKERASEFKGEESLSDPATKPERMKELGSLTSDVNAKDRAMEFVKKQDSEQEQIEKAAKQALAAAIEHVQGGKLKLAQKIYDNEVNNLSKYSDR
eukprot:165988-Hanusia_phi.AAC.1